MEPNQFNQTPAEQMPNPKKPQSFPIIGGIIAVVLIIIILVGVYIFYYSSNQSKSLSPPAENIGLTEAEKEKAAKIMNQQLTNVPPLTTQQKEDIAKKMEKKLSE